MIKPIKLICDSAKDVEYPQSYLIFTKKFYKIKELKSRRHNPLKLNNNHMYQLL
jgi:hypothetical protein